MKRIFALPALFSTALLFGCASTTPDFQSPVDDYEHRGVVFMADIEDTSDGWMFTNLSGSGEGGDEVRLDTLEYVGSTGLKDESCIAGFLGLTNGNCDNNRFQSPAPSAKDYVMSVSTMPLTQFFLVPVLAPLTMDADILVLPLFSSSTKFDWDAYADAAEEAKYNDNFSDRFPRVYDQFVTLKSDVAEYSFPVGESNIRETRSKINDRWRAQLINLQDTADQEVELKVVDKSGLASGSGYSSDLGAQDVMRFDHSFSVDRSSFKSRLKDRTSEELGFKEVPNVKGLAFDDISDFESETKALTDQFKQVKRHNESITDSVREKRRSDNQFNDDVLERLEGALASAQLTRSYEPDPSWELNSSKRYDFHINYDIPEKTVISANGEHQGTDLDMVVESVDIDKAFHPALSGASDGLEVELDNAEITMTNTTDDYITIHSVSFYYRDQVLTQSVDYDIPPTAKQSDSLRSLFDYDRIPTKFPWMTLEKARNTDLKYGVSIRYTVSGQGGGDATLKEVESFPLDELIRDQTSLL